MEYQGRFCRSRYREPLAFSLAFCNPGEHDSGRAFYDPLFYMFINESIHVRFVWLGGHLDIVRQEREWRIEYGKELYIARQAWFAEILA
jgi:hypothetical protein